MNALRLLALAGFDALASLPLLAGSAAGVSLRLLGASANASLAGLACVAGALYPLALCAGRVPVALWHAGGASSTPSLMAGDGRGSPNGISVRSGGVSGAVRAGSTPAPPSLSTPSNPDVVGDPSGAYGRISPSVYYGVDTPAPRTAAPTPGPPLDRCGDNSVALYGAGVSSELPRLDTPTEDTYMGHALPIPVGRDPTEKEK